MLKIYLRLIFSIFIVLLQPLARGDDTYAIKPDTSSFSTGSCTDRCHVNYMVYHTVYQGKVFQHKTHSPNQGLECSQCHNNDAVHTKTHGGLIIQNKDCWVCHHKRDNKTISNPFFMQDKENASHFPISKPFINKALVESKGDEGFLGKTDCLHCHADVKDYINGDIQIIGIKIPDWMSQAVSCTDCHKLESGGYSFKPVREYCIECHNQDYGLLYDAWKEVLDSKIKQFCGNDNTTRDSLRLIQSYGIHNFRLSQILLNHD
ncbi:MAG: hypothetical protein E3K36_14815 [Candidatus Brocadia sp.]|nr:hypothetical protein [Candidatus Brocadia sp.]